MHKLLSSIHTGVTEPGSPKAPDSAAVGNDGEKSPPLWHYLAIFLIPFALSLINPNWCFQGVGHVDPWYYFGEFAHATQFDRIASTYATERMTWNVPGYVLVHIFGQVPGVIILHFTVFLLSVYSLHYLLKRLTDYRTAFAGAVLLGCHPFFIGANGWDYPEGMAIALILLSLALAIHVARDAQRQQDYIFLSSMAWAGMVYTYIGWAAFTPAYLYVVLRANQARDTNWRRWQNLAKVGTFLILGMLATTGVLSCAYWLLGGEGFFFKQNILTALYLAKLKTNPWVISNWYEEPSWLFFPALAGLLALVSLAPGIRRRLSRREMAAIHFGLYCLAFMVIMTFDQNRLLALDYRTSILLPGVFLTLSILLARVPTALSNALFYPGLAVCACICLAPLRHVNWYHFKYYWLYVTPIVVALGILGCFRLIRHKNSLAWIGSMTLWGALSFPLVPQTPGLAWKWEYPGREISERTGRAIRAIAKVIPPNRIPSFWVNNTQDRLSREFRGIRCSFISIDESMLNYPEFDATRKLSKDQIIVVLTDSRDIVDGTLDVLRRAGISATLVKQDPVDYARVSYWISYFKILKLPSSSFPSALNAEPDHNLIPNGRFDFGSTAWDLQNGILQITKDCHHHGNCGEFVANGGTAEALIYRGLPSLKMGGAYRFGAAVKSASSVPQTLAIGVWDPVTSHWVGKRDIIADPTWSEIEFTFNNNSAHALVVMFYQQVAPGPGPGSWIVDEVSLSDLSSPGEKSMGQGVENSSGTASFVKKDLVTKGNWVSVYGRDGYLINAEGSNPSFVKPTAIGQTPYTWVASTQDGRAPQRRSSPTQRSASCWYSPSLLTIDLPFTDKKEHQVALYLLDWDTVNRREKIQVVDPNGRLLDERNITDTFHDGVYLIWKIKGHVSINVELTSGANAAFSGLFFDPPPSH